MDITYPQSVGAARSVAGTSQPEARSPFRWREVLFGGIGIWAAMLVALVVTKNTALLPAVALIGAGIVPLAITLHNGTRLAGTTMILDDLLYAFLLGGTLGLLIAGVFNAVNLQLLGYRGAMMLAGVVEEAAKVAVLLWVAHRVPARSMRSGIYLGAAVGAGFAWVETIYYALSGLLDSDTHATITTNLGSVVAQVAASEISRGLMAPFLHITYSAILGGALFAAVRDGRFRLTASVIGAYGLVALLHGVWDAGIPYLAEKAGQAVDAAHTAGPLSLGDWSAVQAGARQSAHVSMAVQIVGELLVMGIGALIIREMTRRARRREAAALATPQR